jgi:hypothetical protein
VPSNRKVDLPSEEIRQASATAVKHSDERIRVEAESPMSEVSRPVDLKKSIDALKKYPQISKLLSQLKSYDMWVDDEEDIQMHESLRLVMQNQLMKCIAELSSILFGGLDRVDQLSEVKTLWLPFADKTTPNTNPVVVLLPLSPQTNASSIGKWAVIGKQEEPIKCLYDISISRGGKDLDEASRRAKSTASPEEINAVHEVLQRAMEVAIECDHSRYALQPLSCMVNVNDVVRHALQYQKSRFEVLDEKKQYWIHKKYINYARGTVLYCIIVVCLYVIICSYGKMNVSVLMIVVLYLYVLQQLPWLHHSSSKPSSPSRSPHQLPNPSI